MATIKKAQNGKELLSPLKGAAFKLRQIEDKKSKLDSLQKAINSEDTTKSLKKLAPNSAKNGGSVKAKDGKWIQKAINPKHKGYCTPQTKATCTPKRKALAQTLRKIAKKK